MTDIIDAMGHHFGPELKCQGCGLHWSDHQREPQPCPKPLSYGKHTLLAKKQEPEGEAESP